MLAKNWSRRKIRIATVIVVVALFAPSAFGFISGDDNVKSPDAKPGVIKKPANGLTVVSTQGFSNRVLPTGNKQAQVVAVDSRGRAVWRYIGEEYNIQRFYDIDPTGPAENKNLLVTATVPSGTLVLSLDGSSGKVRWVERLPFDDTHDVDPLSDGRLLVANMKQWNESTGRSDDRVVIYNRTRNEVVWEWTVRNYYPSSTDGGMDRDWTHINDVDMVGESRILVSLRNFDQVVLVNHSTRTIEWTLGVDGNHTILHEQHNPDYIDSGGRPAVLVADSENDRVIEYIRQNRSWKERWVLTGNLNWPRDADRLPNGHSLVTDSLNHRVVEVTTQGMVVWEVLVPWAPYDAERIHVDNDGEASISSLGGSTHVSVSGGTERLPENRYPFSEWLDTSFVGTSIDPYASWVATRWKHIIPWVRPRWLGPSQFLSAVLGSLVTCSWLFAEFLYRQKWLLYK